MRIGVIGGSGLYGFDGVAVREEISLRTPFGEPSAPFAVSDIAGREVVFLPRHGTHNDHVTPMDFVVHVLKNYFYLSNSKAADIMLAAHIYGMALVQTLARSEAEKRINKAHAEANNAGYPLKFTLEPE